MYSVLFICSANICRSPMAMGLLKDLVRDEANDWNIDSAGVWAIVGAPVDEHVQLVLQERGMDVTEHRSTQVTEEIISQFNLVLTMGRTHKEALQAAFSNYRERIYMFSEMIGEISDIADPIGKPLSEFEALASELDEILERGIQRIRELA